MTDDARDTWSLAGLALTSRIMVGTSRFPSRQILLEALAAAGAEVATVAVRRVGLEARVDSLYEALQAGGYRILPNTAGCFTVRDAEETAAAAAEALDTQLLKLEVIADEDTLLPDTDGVVEAARRLVKKGFTVLPYTSDDPVVARKLEDVGCAAVMPLGAPIGSGLGIRNPVNLRLIRARAGVPVILDAGVGTASDLALALELGCDAVLLSSAISRAKEPVQMAAALRHAALAGRQAHLVGRMPVKFYGDTYTQLEGRARSG